MNITLTRSLLVILLPGAMFLMPWVVFILSAYPDCLKTYESYKYEYVVVLFGLSVFTGMLLEGLGASIEVHWDRIREVEYDIKKNWYAYLAAQYEAEIVGYKYITSRVTTMYFELGMMWVAMSAAISSWFLLYSFNSECFILKTILITMLCFIAMIYFYRMAYSSHEVLCKARQEINGLNGR
ncbi:MAG: hypothetical protein LRY66_05970 [Saccharospirillaceae bacterium]|nr:hypothetical protein [Saccharospirillaceae bacterium]MCD8530902.1 hypothetical protein [Saccharospirillaceae bacterium]